jgi:hypothetical protein
MANKGMHSPGRVRFSRERCCLVLLLGLLSCSSSIQVSEASSSAVPASSAGPISASEALEHGFRAVFGEKKSGSERLGGRRRRRSAFGFKYYTSGAETVLDRPTSTSPAADDRDPKEEGWQLQQKRRVEEVGDDNEAAVDDDFYQADDDGAANDGADYNSNYDDDDVNEACSQYLVSFLEGTTDARDTCEGIMNAYTAAGELVVTFILPFVVSFFLLNIFFLLARC